MRIHPALRAIKKSLPPAPSNFLDYKTFVSSTADATSFTFSGVSLGTEYSNRVIVIAAFGVNPTTPNATISSITVGGTTMGNVWADISGANVGARLTYQLIPAGTTADVVVNFANSVTTCGAAIFSTTSSLAAASNGYAQQVTSAAASLAVETAANGFAIGMRVQYNNPVRTLSSVAGYTTTHVNTAVDSFNRVFVGSWYPSANSASRTFTVTNSSTSTLSSPHLLVARIFA